MKTLLLSLATVASVAAAAAPAAAQPWRGDDYRDQPRYEHRYDHRGDERLMTPYVDGLAWKIDNAARYGRISWPQARELRAEFQSVKPIAWRVQTGQASGWERERLARAVDHIDRAVQGDDDRGYGDRGYGYRDYGYRDYGYRR